MTYNALFSNISGLEEGNFVRVAGVEVGKVKKISIQPDTTVLVEFAAEPSVVLTEGSRAVIRYDDVIGGRYLALEEGAGGTKKLNPGDTIPLARTAPALDLDALDRGLPALVSGAEPRPGQRPVEPVDPRLPGARRRPSAPSCPRPRC